MPSRFRLRNLFRPLIIILAKGLNKIGIKPNQATFLMVLFSFLGSCLLILFSNLLVFSIFIFLTGIFDGVDGAIARLTKKETTSGGFLDSVMDRLSEFIIFFGLLIYCWEKTLFNFIDMKLIILFSLFSSIMISYLRARAEVLFKGDFDIGLMARSERLFYLFITCLISHFYGYLNEFLFVFMILVILTAFIRYFKIIRLIMEFEAK
ncbi:MAG: CDP-alcohol phosphatidyltransferase family protein [Candidatus Hodarchaeota archaeon]